jgi:predicted exporter
MKRAAPWLWLLAVALVVLYLGLRLYSGITLQSNILALLPRAERDETAQRIQDGIANSFSRRVVFLVGNNNPAKARGAGLMLASTLEHSGFVSKLTSKFDPDAQRKLGAAYFPFRAGLLSETDRADLLSNNGKAVVLRAQSVLFGPGGFANGKLMAHDPFFLLPSFFTSLPLPRSKLTPDGGVLSVRDGDTTYVLVSAELAGDPFSTSFQEHFHDFVDSTTQSMVRASPGTKLLRAGAVFYAREAASEATGETSTIGSISIIGTLALVLLVFRGLRPILLGFLAIGTGVACAFAGTLLLFGELHTVALLFGVSLIGVSVDYSLQYFSEYFDPEAATPQGRLRRVAPGIAIGLITTLIGYLTLLLAPFPGLRQVAAFSVIGLIASVLTVLLWYPRLDKKDAPKLGRFFVDLAARHWLLWQAPTLRLARFAIMGVCILLGVIGVFRLHMDDDVRHLQSLSPDLKQQEVEVQRLTGSPGGSQFLLVRAANEQKLLETEERLVDRLSVAQRQGALGDFQAVAQFVPSVARQMQNRALVRDRLNKPFLTAYLSEIGYGGVVDYAMPRRFLLPRDVPKTGPLSLLQLLDVGTADHPAHVVLLGGIARADVLQQISAGIPGVRFVNLTDDWSRLFATYRRYAIALLALSAVLMYPMLAWRYGWLPAIRVMLPSIAAASLAPPLAALAGVSFTFFNAMALVLVLSIGVDYSVFCRETWGSRKPVTMLAIALAALSTILSFGLLALSRVFAVHAFGTTMLIGIFLAFLFAPAAGDATAGTRRGVSP